MKKIAIPAALAVAFAGAGAAAVPSMLDHARAAESVSRTITLQAPAERAALIEKAGTQTDAFVSALGLTSDDSFTVTDVVKDSDGSTHVRLDRTYQGIPVVGGDVVIHRDPSGTITGHSGMFDGKITVSTSPKLTAAQIAPKGLAAAKSTHSEDGLTGAKNSDSELTIYVSPEGEQTLTYRVQTEGFTNDRTPSRVQSFIDATSGDTVLSYDEIAHASGNGVFTGQVTVASTKTSSGYELRNPDNGGFASDSGNKKVTGTVVTSTTDSFGDGTMNDRTSAAVDAQYGADVTFDYYKNILGRNGIWDNGKGTQSRVHYDNNYVNAFWDGKQMTYGDGANNANPLTELDVAGHEMTHGVTQNSARLAYSGDAGGLNEATSDIFGTAVEWHAKIEKDTPDYLIGELIDIHGNKTPLRYMDQPSKDGKSVDCWSGTVSTMDPHYSSGPLNHWFFLAAEGSGSKTINGVAYNSPTCNNKSVTGAGRGAMEKVWYRTLATKLSSGSTYRDAREGAIQSATELFGGSSKECVAVESAFDAISVPKGSATCSGGPAPTTTPAPTTPAPTTPAPTTPAPTTPAPTTPAPTTPAPTTPAPTTPAPTTPAPTTPAPTPAGGVVNGDFEAAGGWTGGTVSTDSTYPAHSGTGKLVLTSGTAQQSITVPRNATLSFYVAKAGSSASASGSLKVQMYDEGTRIGYNLGTISAASLASGYTQQSFPVTYYAGKKMRIRLIGSGGATFLIDDVATK